MNPGYTSPEGGAGAGGAVRTLRAGELTIDHAQRLVTVAGRPVQLTATEYNLLAELSVHAGRVVPYDDLRRGAGGVNHSGSPRMIRTYLMRLRCKLGDSAANPRYILTEPRVGYRMAAGEGETPEPEQNG